MVRLAGVDPDGAEVWLLVIYFVSKNLEQGMSVSVMDQKLAHLVFVQITGLGQSYQGFLGVTGFKRIS